MPGSVTLGSFEKVDAARSWDVAVRGAIDRVVWRSARAAGSLRASIYESKQCRQGKDKETHGDCDDLNRLVCGLLRGGLQDKANDGGRAAARGGSSGRMGLSQSGLSRAACVRLPIEKREILTNWGLTLTTVLRPMQNGHHTPDNNDVHVESLSAVNGIAETNGAANGTHAPEAPDDAPILQNGVATLQSATASPGPRGQKRKLIDVASGKSSRAPSPPWKKIQAEGPTTIIENGRRKSGRVNAVPTETEPQKAKRPTRESQRRPQAPPTPSARQGTRTAHTTPKGTQTASATARAKQSAKAPAQSSPRVQQAIRRGAGKVKASPTSQGTATKSTRRSGRVSLPQQNETNGTTEAKANGTAQPTRAPKYFPKGYVNYIPGPLPILNPRNVLPPQQYTTLREYFENDDPLEDEDGEHRFTEAEAKREAVRVQRVIDAQQPGRPFADGSRLIIEAQTQDEPVPQPAHPHIDHVVNHALELRRLMQIERNNHLKMARAIAHAVAAKVKTMQPETEEEKQARQFKEGQQRYKLLLKELVRMFDAAKASVTNEMLRLHQQEEEDRAREEMRKMTEKAENLLQGRTGGRFALPGEETRGSSLLTDNMGSISGDSGDFSRSEADSDNGDSDDSSADSDSSSDSNDDDQADNSDDELNEEQLRAKYSTMDVSKHSGSPPTSDVGSERDPSAEPMAETTNLPDLEEVDQALLDDSDAESSSGTEESSEEDSEEESSVGEEDDGVENSLWGLFSKSERQQFEQGEAPPDAQDVTMEDDEEAVESAAEGTAAEVKMEDVDNTTDARSKAADDTETIEASSDQKEEELVDAQATVEEDGADVEEIGREPRVPTPSLLRGTLRPYQQEGLDWLARMYANDTNGILADEMGLGKTIQSISLLAHLATYHEVWGPHLVVVPTSVLLNWEVEFKKFAPGFKVLSYYGTQEERKAKRKGWMDNDKWHICITSYQLAVQDAMSLKKRDWHYIILDEAHNIKNFRSQRWQTLLNFRSRARLLLTGTPLQNSLTELWSLLFFLAPEEDEQGRSQFGELAEFAKQFSRPVEQILDKGATDLDIESRGIVSKLHTILRPHLLRRMKSEVEKQMPKKYEHITVCRLSKRQRQLYDEFMGRTDTKESFASRNYMSIISCLMALRKVCNHPDLFETRSINTSYAMPKAAIADFEIKELLVRRKMLAEEDNNTSYRLLNMWRPNVASHNANTSRGLAAFIKLADAAGRQRRRLPTEAGYDGSTLKSAISGIDSLKRHERHSQLATQYSQVVIRSWEQPVLPLNVLNRLIVPLKGSPSNSQRTSGTLTDAYLNSATAIQDMIVPLSERSAQLQPYIQRFGCVTPKVISEDMTRFALTDKGIDTIQDARDLAPDDNFHEARMRLSIAFPDKTLIQYDCGKLQQLAKLLRKLQAGGHRALIFTQMTKVLDVLEQFLNLHGYRYMRLDGTTKIERRQVLTDRFNADPTFLCFILSTRSGGLGINLTGADTVIFYDNDWNPAMDKQCQDRCHRIGQTRDVHIYRFVCEGTIEMNILRKSNQKRELDKFIIQEGDFTTDFLSRMGEGDAEADDAIEQVLGGGAKDALTKVEDKDDIAAAQVAEKEYVHADDADFEDKQPTSGSAGTPQRAQTGTPAAGEGPTPVGEQATPSQQTETPAAGAGTPVPAADTQGGAPAVEDFEIEDEDGGKISAPGLDRNIRELDGWLLQTMRTELSGLRFPTAEEARKRLAKNKRRKAHVPLIRR
ncbi:hypothetical protein FH972_025182 [Carpinus fangiana]|uniref:DNA helicase n=1 Tax=Carpinus fangiana TaxID=176857 RepID=A0A5N6L099_9ROSI|nr:hypothetical protein FH972_025182 [Carpinus fangiana]